MGEQAGGSVLHWPEVSQMEKLLQELSSASKLLIDFKEMYEYENRLKTFTKWPFQENCKCTPENVSLKMVVLSLS